MGTKAGETEQGASGYSPLALTAKTAVFAYVFSKEEIRLIAGFRTDLLYPRLTPGSHIHRRGGPPSPMGEGWDAGPCKRRNDIRHWRMIYGFAI